jgi:CubicO group peptidase (beta-lactamase class C family)
MSDAAAALRDNGAFYPAPTASAAPPFHGSLRISQTPMQFAPALVVSNIGGRNAQLFPQSSLDFFTVDDLLIPVQRGQMVAEDPTAPAPSYWSLIPQFGRVWRDTADDSGWSRAACPLMLVNDLENHAHQGLASFRYKDAAVSGFRFQFVQQTAPYLLKQHFVAWGSADVEYARLPTMDLQAAQEAARRELAARTPSRPWADLASQVGSDTLAGFGGPLNPEWIVATALLREGTLYYADSMTPCGAYPYPLEMRFGVRSVMKSIAAPLSLLRLAQVYGPHVLNLKIGQHVAGLDEKFDTVRFIDAANMATGFGGTGTLRTQPNEFEDGYLEADYDGWYTAASHAEKMAHMAKWQRPYPWKPGTVLRYRDHDFYVLGAAVDFYLKSVRGPDADVWDMLCEEVFAPIGISAAPATRTREPRGQRGLTWFNAGYFPTLDDIAKIALLYQNRGEWGGRQILHRELTTELLSARGALSKSGGAPIPSAEVADSLPEPLAFGKSTHYRMGFHFTPYHSRGRRKVDYLPTMWGSGESEVILYPNGLVSIRIGKAAGSIDERTVRNPSAQTTPEVVNRLGAFS